MTDQELRNQAMREALKEFAEACERAERDHGPLETHDANVPRKRSDNAPASDK